MVVHPALRGTIGGLAALLLLWLGWEGISGGVTQWSDVTTVSQRVQNVTQLAYGVFAVLVLVTAMLQVGVRSQNPEIRNQKPEIRNQKSI